MNDVPVIVTVDSIYSGAVEDTPYSVPAPGLVATASDADGNGTLHAVPDAVTTANGGTVTVAEDGGFTYKPPANYEGVDEFAYTVTDRFVNVTGRAKIAVGECHGETWKACR